jgi:hypothetical protein
MKLTPARVLGIALLVAIVPAAPIQAQLPDKPSSVTMPVAGTFSNGGRFEGTVTINRFEARDNGIVALGFVRGVLTRRGETLGTGFAGELAWPVAVKTGGISAVSGNASRAPQFQRVSSTESRHRIMRVQATTCPVLQIALGPLDVNLLGAQVALEPVGLNVAGEQGTPLGDLVCSVSALLGNVAGLVDVLNGILGLLTGLLGGLTGGIV